MQLQFLQSHAWQVSLGRFVVLLAVALALGWWLGTVEYAVIAALLGYSLRSLVSLYRLQSWLRSRQRTAPPEDRGVWSDISTYMHMKLHAERSRKRRLVNLLRAFREGTAAPRDRGAHIDDFLPPPAKTWFNEDPTREPLRDAASNVNDAVRLSFRLIPYSYNHSLLVVRDMTPLARLEQVRRDFVANVSHELRTPLTVLHGDLEMLEPE